MEFALNPPQPFLKRLSVFDWLFALALTLGAGYALNRYGAYMDAYDKGVLIGMVPALARSASRRSSPSTSAPISLRSCCSPTRAADSGPGLR